MEFRRRILIASAAASAVMLAGILVSPFLAPSGAFLFDGGTPGLIDGWWRGHGAAGIPYAIGDVICHQELERSFVLNGSQLPVCMRDTGIVAGVLLGLALCSLSGRVSYPDSIAVIGAVLIQVMVVEWAVETGGSDFPVLRTASGVCAGAGASLFLAWMLYREPDDRQLRIQGGRRMAVRRGIHPSRRLPDDRRRPDRRICRRGLPQGEDNSPYG